MSQPKESASIFVIVAGPAGSGKTTLCERLVASEDSIERVITSTTRPPRAGETDGVDYYFFDNSTFDAKVEAGDFVEWAKVHNNRYGTLKQVIHDKLAQDIDLVMNVDVQGVINFKKAAKKNASIASRLVTVFVNVPDIDELTERLRERGSDDAAEIERRLQTARWELTQWESFDYVITSSTKDADYAAVLSIFAAEKRRSQRLV